MLVDFTEIQKGINTTTMRLKYLRVNMRNLSTGNRDAMNWLKNL